MKRAIAPLAALCMLLPCAAQGPKSGEEVKLEVIKAKDLAKRLEEFRGKVLVVDIWADFCAPCKKEFPHLVELRDKYAKKGVACVSVSVDMLEDRDKALEFLKKQKATFTNFLLDETQKGWQKHFDILGPPVVLVYNADGKLAKKFDAFEAEYTYAEVEKVVQKLLEK